MEQFKRAQVIILPTTNDVNALKGYSDNSLLFKYAKQYKAISAECNYVSFFHLYIISTDKIKEGDWYITIKTNYIGKPSKCIKIDAISVISQLEGSDNPNHTQYTEFKFAKKIIATTDTSLNSLQGDKLLGGTIVKSLPQLSQQFIEKYIESYNKREVITDVLVEYEYRNDRITKGDMRTQLKVNSKDNTITIKKLKNSWNREEVFALITTFNNAKVDAPNVLKWIENNL